MRIDLTKMKVNWQTDPPIVPTEEYQNFLVTVYDPEHPKEKPYVSVETYFNSCETNGIKLDGWIVLDQDADGLMTTYRVPVIAWTKTPQPYEI